MAETAPPPEPTWPSHWKPVVLTRFMPIRPEDVSQTNIPGTEVKNSGESSNQGVVHDTHQNRELEVDLKPAYSEYIDIEENSVSDVQEDNNNENNDHQNGDRDTGYYSLLPGADGSSGYPGHTDIDELSVFSAEDNNNNESADLENGGRDTSYRSRHPRTELRSRYPGHTDIDQESITTTGLHYQAEKVRSLSDIPIADAQIKVQNTANSKNVDAQNSTRDTSVDVQNTTYYTDVDVQNSTYYRDVDVQNSTYRDVDVQNTTHDTNVDVQNTTHNTDVEVQDTTNDEDGDDLYGRGPCSRAVEKIETFLGHHYSRYKHFITAMLKFMLFLAYIAYFAYCVYYRYYDEGSYILTAITCLIIIKLLSDKLLVSCVARTGCSCVLVKYGTSGHVKLMRRFLRYGLYLAAMSAVSVYLGLDVLRTHPQNAQALIGVAALVFLCFLFSFKPSKVNWHPVFWGFIIQIVFAILTLRTWAGFVGFKWIGDLIFRFVRLSDKGSAFVFGDTFRHTIAGFFIDSAGVIVFFNACIFMLDTWGVLEFIVLKLGRGLAFCLETGPVESVVAAANIFIGLSEAPVIVRPFLPTVTRSELHAIMTCGFSSISGAFMAMFIKAGAPANHLLTASVISAPAGLAISKLMYPEIETVNYASQRHVKMRDSSGEEKNTLQACSDGAAFSVKMIGSIMVNMLAFVSLMNLVDSLLVWLGDRAGVEDMTFDLICSYVLWPLSYIMGVPSEDCGKVGSLIGVKMMATPFVAYRDLGNVIKVIQSEDWDDFSAINRGVLEAYIHTSNGSWHWSGKNVVLDNTNTTLVGGVLTERAEVIATYALCGLSAFPAIGFSMGTLIPMCPARKKDVVEVVIRAFIAGNLANFATGTIAGVMFTPLPKA